MIGHIPRASLPQSRPDMNCGRLVRGAPRVPSLFAEGATLASSHPPRPQVCVVCPRDANGGLEPGKTSPAALPRPAARPRPWPSSFRSTRRSRMEALVASGRSGLGRSWRRGACQRNGRHKPKGRRGEGTVHRSCPIDHAGYSPRGHAVSLRPHRPHRVGPCGVEIPLHQPARESTSRATSVIERPAPLSTVKSTARVRLKMSANTAERAIPCAWNIPGSRTGPVGTGARSRLAGTPWR